MFTSMLLPPSFGPFLAYYAGLIDRGVVFPPSPKNACVGVYPFLSKFRTMFSRTDTLQMAVVMGE